MDNCVVISQPCLNFGDGEPHPTAINDVYRTLENVKELVIHQHLDAFEVCMGWERNNRYSVYTKSKEQILYVYEAAQCYARQCYGSLRELSLIVTDNDDNKLLQLHRPLRCSSRCCYASCNLQEMTILLPSKESIGNVLERWSCCIPHYEVHDEAGNLCFVINGDFCHFRCCCVINFNISNAQGENVASIRSLWGGCSSVIGAFNKYTILYRGRHEVGSTTMFYLEIRPIPVKKLVVDDVDGTTWGGIVRYHCTRLSYIWISNDVF